jgi:hypothetical protein
LFNYQCDGKFIDTPQLYINILPVQAIIHRM